MCTTHATRSSSRMSLLSDSEPSSDNRIPIWLDCDPGHDDALAIILASADPAFRLLGISTVHGNASLDKVTNNALSLLVAIGRPEIPVHPGARKPFLRPSIHAPDIHGDSGIDGTDLLPSHTGLKAQSLNGPEAMRNAIMSTEPGTCILIATGSLTNAALMFATFPETLNHIKTFSCMCGGFDLGAGLAGNITQFAEFNIYCDPESASSIFTQPALSTKICMIPLDLTHTILATTAVRDALLLGKDGHNTTFRTMLHDLMMYFADTYARVFNMTEGPPVHDPVAVAAVIPALSEAFEWEEGHVQVVLHGEELGRTILHKIGKDLAINRHHGEHRMATDEEKGVSSKVVVRVGKKTDVNVFWSRMMAAITKADEASPLKTRN